MIRLYERWLEAVALAMASLILTGCASTPEEPSSESFVLTAGQSAVFSPDGTAKVFRNREEREAYDEAKAQEEAEADALREERRRQSLALLSSPDSQPYFNWLCSLSPDSREYKDAMFLAAGKYGIVPKTDPEADALAESRGLALLDCAERASSRATE